MKRKLQLKQIDLHLDDQAAKVSLSVEDLKDPNNNIIGEKLVLVDNVLQGELNSIANNIATVQADVDQNELDADAAIAAVQADVDQNEIDADAGIAANAASIASETTARQTADAALQGQITANDTDISGLQTFAADLETAIDDTQEGAGLAADGSYPGTNISGRPFGLDAATSLDDADVKLAAAITQEIADRQAAINGALASEMSFRGDLDASSATSFASFGAIAKGDMWVVTTAGSKLDENLEAGDMVIAKVAGAQLGQSPVEFAYVQKNFDLSSYATVVAMNAAIAAVQSDVDQNEVDSDAGIAANASDIASEVNARVAAVAAVQADVNQNEIDSDAMDAAIIGGAGLDANGDYTAPAVSAYLGSASTLKDADIRLDTAASTNATNITNLVASLTAVSGFDFCSYYTMDEADLNATGTPSEPQIRFQANPHANSLRGGFTIDYDKLAPAGMPQERIKSKVLVTLNGLQLKGKVGSVDTAHEYGITFNANGATKELAIEFAEGLLDGGDVICIMLARGI